MAARDLLDPRWHWIRQAVERLYRELEPGTRNLTLSLGAESADGEALMYQMAMGANEVHKLLLTGDVEAIADAMRSNTLSLDVEL